MVPMSDVPAAALWTAALYLAVRGGVGMSSALAGVCAALAILVRPNLAPLAVVVLAFVAWPDIGEANRRAAWKRAAWFSLPFVPAVCAIAIVNWRLYGSPASSGYGDLGPAFAVSHIAANARRYTAWLVQTQTPLILLSAVGFLAPWTTGSRVLTRRISALFLMFTLAVTVSYLPYSVFEEWWYLRFFLPALPLLLVSMTASIVRALTFLPPAARVLAVVSLGTFLVAHELRFAIDAGVTRLQRNERRYVAVARFIEAATPPNAVFLALQHGGSVRHYADRLTIRFDRVDTGLDEALASLDRAGWRPFILLEDWEEPQFKAQFGASSAVGRLGWRPYARLSDPGGVNIYDPKQAGDTALHELAVIPPPAGCDCRHY
jgi:hypothetical protein